MRQLLALACACFIVALPWTFPAAQEAAAESAAPRQVQPLLPDTADWGSPVPQQVPVVLPDFPPLAGWWRYLGQEHAALLAAGYGRLLTAVGQELRAYDSHTGALLWARPGSDWTGFADRVLDAQHVYVASAGAVLEALDAASGAALWQIDGCVPLAAGPGRLWMSYGRFSSSGAGARQVWLADSADGNVLARFYIGACRAVAHDASANLPLLAAVDGGEVVVMHADGSMQRAPAYTNSGDAQVAVNSICVFVAEKVSDAQTGATTIALSCYDADTAALRWRVTLAQPEYAMFDALTASERFCTLDAAYQLLLYDAATGQLLNTAYAAKLGYGYSQQLLSGDRAYVYGGNEKNKGYWELVMLQPPSKQRQRVFQPKLQLNFMPLIADGYMYQLVNSRPPASNSGDNYSLFAYRLGDDGLAKPGELALLNRPQPDTTTERAFAASPAPLADSELMRQLVAGSRDALVRLTRQTTAADGAHLDALAALAVYLDRRDPLQPWQGDTAGELFIGELRKLAAPELAPTLVRWLDDDSLAPRHLDFLLTLALCGLGAEPELKRRYAELQPQRYAAPAPPYRGEFRQAVIDAYLAKYHNASRDQAEDHATPLAEGWCDGADGARYVVYTSPGLLSLADLYVCVDENGDGELEEVLPTGLRHLAVGVRDDRYASQSLPPEDLALSFADGALLIHHQEPIIEKRTLYSSGLRSHSADTRLTFDELRRDSDGDGLTDITEGMLFTDPALADTDGDGLSDGEDPAPRVDAAKMNRLERAAARGMTAFFARYPVLKGTGLLRHPREAYYFRLSGVGPVAAAPSAGMQGIHVDEALSEAYYARAGYGWAKDMFYGQLIPPSRVVQAEMDALTDGVQFDSRGFPVGLSRAAQQEYDRLWRYGFGARDEYCIEIWYGDTMFFINFQRVGSELYPSAVGYGGGGTMHIPFM